MRPFSSNVTEMLRRARNKAVVTPMTPPPMTTTSEAFGNGASNWIGKASVKGKLVKEDCPLAIHGGVGPRCRTWLLPCRRRVTELIVRQGWVELENLLVNTANCLCQGMPTPHAGNADTSRDLWRQGRKRTAMTNGPPPVRHSVMPLLAP
ncbi:hypothetical protein [Mesorhizobium huakuii]|uniref:Uncharacterized protein n=1 Tax=Mesorhizobium huakuii TaxID=28104 RepID=A0ABZ0VMU8_9HYPH|nr:hypothetical protein [Mesorhizobium huakuii]WQB97649.1 hypothetical protein U0R22_001786 [Mesorhizobium huakuii]